MVWQDGLDFNNDPGEAFHPMLKGCAVLLVAYLLLCAVVYVWQRSLIYHPTPAYGSSVGEAVAFPVSGAVLQLWRVRRPGPSAVIYFGGNAEVVAVNAEGFARAVPDRTWVFVNYRGYGGSSGAPSETALVADALALFDAMQGEYPEIAVIGRSLGSGVAMQLAAARRVHRLVLITPFDSLVGVGRDALPWLPVSWLAKDRYDSVNYAPRIQCPTLVLIAAEDRVVAPSHGLQLVAGFARDRASVVIVPGAQHNDIQLWPNFESTIGRFLTSGT